MPRGRGARAERPQALGLERVHEPGDERRLGPDDGQVGPLVGGQPHEAVDVLGRHVEAARVARDAGVAGRAQHLGRARAAPQRAHDRVLAAAAADDQDPSLRHCGSLIRDVAGDRRRRANDERRLPRLRATSPRSTP